MEMSNASGVFKYTCTNYALHLLMISRFKIGFFKGKMWGFFKHEMSCLRVDDEIYCSHVKVFAVIIINPYCIYNDKIS